ncbi:MAG: hypothetical protein GY938_16650 [Ketobacter sp.]|nr:hypothetical protein [Ketobacter sp.]
MKTNMGTNLQVARYDGAARSNLTEVFSDLANVGVRWALPGGLQRFEFTIKANSRWDAYERYNSHHGDGIALLDNWLDRPICDGWIYEVIPDNRHVTYVVGGAWKRHSDQYRETNPVGPGTVSDAYLETVLSGHVPAASGDYSQIIPTFTQMGNVFEVDPVFGDRIDEIVKTILDMGTFTAGSIIDYWLVPQLLDGLVPQLPQPYLWARQNIESAADKWRIRRRDLSQMSISRHIWRMENDTVIYYTKETSVNTNEAEGQTSITVSSISGFSAGDEVSIELDGGRTFGTTIKGTPTGTTIVINDALPDAASTGNIFRRLTPTATSAATDGTSIATRWQREHREYRRDFDKTQAEQYRDLRQAAYTNPIPQLSFTIGAGKVRKDNTLYPLHRMLINPGYLQIDDLFPNPSIGDLDGKSVFRIIALDYDHNSRKMSVTPDSFDGESRLDVYLQQLGLNVGQIVKRSRSGATQ